VAAETQYIITWPRTTCPLVPLLSDIRSLTQTTFLHYPCLWQAKAVEAVLKHDRDEPLVRKSWTSELFWREGVERRNVINSEILTSQASNAATRTRDWNFLDSIGVYYTLAIYGNAATFNTPNNLSDTDITVAVVFTFVLCQALCRVSNWLVRIWNLRKDAYESQGRRLVFLGDSPLTPLLESKAYCDMRYSGASVWEIMRTSRYFLRFTQSFRCLPLILSIL
jgi:hypothetical protein